MTTSRSNFALAFVAGGLLLAGCSSTLPQSDKTFTGPLSAEREARMRENRLVLSDAEDKELDAIDRERLALALDLKVFGKASDDPRPVAGFGFASQSHGSYVIYRDGSGNLFSDTGTETSFESMVKRLEGVFPAGPEAKHIIGTHPRGTMMVLDTGNPEKHIVLRPQTSTFNQVHVYDIATIADLPYIAMATEGGQLELWDMNSGDRIEVRELADVQPRRILDGSSLDRIVFGTNEGEVREWNKVGDSTTLYRHVGPVLDLQYVAARDILVSSAKDGTLIIYDRAAQAVLDEIEFETVAYRVHVSPDGTHVIAIPSLGIPYVINLETMEGFELSANSGADIVDGQFIGDGNLFIARQGADRLYIWDVRHGAAIAEIQPQLGGGLLDFAVSEETGLLMVATTGNTVEYWDLKSGSYISTPIKSEKEIAGISVSDDGKRALVALNNGQMVDWQIDRDISGAYVLNDDNLSG
ncbi:hypothetical protein L6172_17700 [Thalassospiraceae bacterium SW-3-3]|nr:hypothetical protein L6172_17700 [Thalassospiraceae bacterium SW-3-3]